MVISDLIHNLDLDSPISFFSSQRHADAIFTNSYRKVLGQISARKILQTIMGKRLGWVTLQLHAVPVKKTTETQSSIFLKLLFTQRKR